MKRYFYIILFALIFIVSCRKPPGEKIAGKWAIQSAFVNGIDKTADIDSLKILYYEFIVLEAGSDYEYYLLHLETSGNYMDSCYKKTGSVIGLYSVSEDKKFLNIGIVSGFIPCLTGKSIVPYFILQTEEWEIKKWRSSVLVLELSTNGNTYKTKLKRIR